jgi:GH35 family endo-1,4-beta-xylanase
MMIPAGYIAKRVVRKPDWLKANGVEDVYSVSGCISKDFADYIKFWKHNGYWFFDSPEIIVQVARKHSIDLVGTTMFYYEVYEQEFDDGKGQWCPYGRDRSFITNICLPEKKTLAGFDVVNSVTRNSPNCSPLSCNSLANEIQTNSHCLLTDFETAKRLVETERFNNSEPGPYRIYAVYTLA